MAGFVPKEKLSKKAQKELNRQRRTTWSISPVTKTVESRKLYNRKRNARGRYDDYGAGASLCSEILSVPSPVIDRMVCHINRVSGNSELIAQQFADLAGQLVV